VLTATATTLVYVRFRRSPLTSRLIADAIGLALFTIGGAQIAEAQHPPIAIVIFMGTITGAARGVVRDVLCGDIPILMRPSELYARTAIHEKLSCFAPIPKFTTGVARPAAGAVGAESALWPPPPPQRVSAPHVISILVATYGCIKNKMEKIDRH
jgi:uncharacterized membrane protein YeiH